MTRRTSRISAPLLALATMCAAAATAGSSAGDAQERPRFQSGASAIIVDATVHDARRRSITGLGADDFEVLDNGVPQRVDQVSYGKLPIDVTVALDVSFSVTGALLDRLRQGVVQLMRDLGREDRLKLMMFNMRVARTTDFATDVKTVERAIRGAVAGGSTALLDSISVALVAASAPDRRQLIVIFTDGSDSSSTTSPTTIISVAQRTRATLAFVMPAASTRSVTSTSPPWTGGPTATTVITRPGSGASHPLFAALAGETGGSILPVGPGTDLSHAFSRVLAEFRAAYVLYYTATGVERGGYHTLTVRVKRDDAIVQARRGYYGS